MFRPCARRRCVSLAAALGDVGYKRTEEKRDTEAMGRIKRKDSAHRGRPAVPDHWTGRPGGSGAQPPLHLIYMVKVESQTRTILNKNVVVLGGASVRCQVAVITELGAWQLC